jgi:hypothetical protein
MKSCALLKFPYCKNLKLYEKGIMHFLLGLRSLLTMDENRMQAAALVPTEGLLCDRNNFKIANKLN